MLYFLDGDGDINVSHSSHNVDVSEGEITAVRSSEWWLTWLHVGYCFQYSGTVRMQAGKTL